LRSFERPTSGSSFLFASCSQIINNSVSDLQKSTILAAKTAYETGWRKVCSDLLRNKPAGLASGRMENCPGVSVEVILGWETFAMSQVPVWFERKFDQSFPLQLLPNLCARLRGTPARLEEILRGQSHEILTRKPLGTWSAQENAGHLIDLEPLWLARVNDFAAARSELTATDLQNRKTSEANHNARPLDELLSQFRHHREKLLRRANELDRDIFAETIPHPRLKTPMSLADHLHFVAEHDDHHLARIWELVAATG
jgi:uncharacterized damage-inducible protein DinB